MIESVHDRLEGHPTDHISFDFKSVAYFGQGDWATALAQPEKQSVLAIGKIGKHFWSPLYNNNNNLVGDTVTMTHLTKCNTNSEVRAMSA